MGYGMVCSLLSVSGGRAGSQVFYIVHNLGHSLIRVCIAVPDQQCRCSSPIRLVRYHVPLCFPAVPIGS